MAAISRQTLLNSLPPEVIETLVEQGRIQLQEHDQMLLSALMHRNLSLSPNAVDQIPKQHAREIDAFIRQIDGGPPIEIPIRTGEVSATQVQASPITKATKTLAAADYAILLDCLRLLWTTDGRIPVADLRQDLMTRWKPEAVLEILRDGTDIGQQMLDQEERKHERQERIARWDRFRHPGPSAAGGR